MPSQYLKSSQEQYELFSKIEMPWLLLEFHLQMFTSFNIPIIPLVIIYLFDFFDAKSYSDNIFLYD